MYTKEEPGTRPHTIMHEGVSERGDTGAVPEPHIPSLSLGIVLGTSRPGDFLQANAPLRYPLIARQDG